MTTNGCQLATISQAANGIGHTYLPCGDFAASPLNVVRKNGIREGAMSETVPLLQSNNDVERLTLKEIAARIGVTYGRLRGFAEAEGVAVFVGAQDVPGVKGVRYPAEAEGLFKHLIEAQDAGLVTPKTAAAWLANVQQQPVPLPGGNGNVVLWRQTDNPAALASALEHIAGLLQSRIEPVEDRLIDAEEASRLLCCNPRRVGRYVKSVRRGRWRRSDVLRYIAAL
jgi:hypothetical protein